MSSPQCDPRCEDCGCMDCRCPAPAEAVRHPLPGVSRAHHEGSFGQRLADAKRAGKSGPLSQDAILDMADGCTLQFHDLLEFARKVERAHRIHPVARSHPLPVSMNNHPIGGPCRLCGRPNIEHGNGQCPTMTMTQLAPHQQRVVTERDELAERLARLHDFLRTPAFSALAVAERLRLRNQAHFMTGYLDVLAERIAAFSAPADPAVTDEMVARFLTWPVPAEVYPDGTPGQPGRTGTNLLSAPQAKAMLQHVLGG